MRELQTYARMLVDQRVSEEISPDMKRLGAAYLRLADLHNRFSLAELEALWIKLWDEMFNTIVESEETKETATVLQEFLRRTREMP